MEVTSLIGRQYFCDITCLSVVRISYRSKKQKSKNNFNEPTFATFFCKADETSTSQVASFLEEQKISESTDVLRM